MKTSRPSYKTVSIGNLRRGTCLDAPRRPILNVCNWFLLAPLQNLSGVSKSFIDTIRLQSCNQRNIQLTSGEGIEKRFKFHSNVVESAVSQRSVAVIGIMADHRVEVVKPFTLSERNLFDLLLKQVELVEYQKEVFMMKCGMSDNLSKSFLLSNILFVGNPLAASENRS